MEKNKTKSKSNILPHDIIFALNASTERNV